MKWFLILLAIGLTASDKLDRTYLPPPGAQFAGGNPGDIQAPLELPNLLQPGTIQIGPNLNGLQEIGANGQPTQVPVTTTSYAFTQTTTYQPIESYETTVAPINPITGLPVQNLGEPGYQQNIQSLPGFIKSNGQLAPSYNDNIQPGFISQGQVSNGQPVNIGSSTYTQTGNQPLNQYSDQAAIGTPGGNNQVLGVAPQQPSINGVYTQYPGDQPNNQIFSQHPNQSTNPGDTIQIHKPGSLMPGVTQGSIQYSGEQILPGQQGSIASTVAPQQISSNNLPEGQYIEIGTKGPYIGQFPQGTYADQPINFQDVGKPEFNQEYRGQDGISQQPNTVEQNIISPGSILGQNIYQPGQNYNIVASTTPTPGIVSSTSAYSSANPIIRTERPQTAGDRNAVILNYENVRTPHGYTYSYDTSNGIHADETGTVGDGTRAQGSYSYTGDDGKVYSVIYTADENGFQPRGDHIPTAPPIPEAIKKVIEQAARDKAAGIIDDGSYDEAKYGYKNYQSPVIYRRPQTHDASKFNNNQFNEAQKDSIRPISGITDVEYDERVPQDQLNDNISIGGIKKPTRKYPSQRPSAKITGDNSASGLSDTQSPKNQGPPGRLPFGEENLSDAEENNDLLNKMNPKRPGTSEPALAGGVKGTKTQYAGSKIEDTDAPGNYPDYEPVNKSEIDNDGTQDIQEDNPEHNNPSQISANASSAIRKQISKQRPNSSRRPDTSNTKYLKGKRPQDSQTFNQGDVDDFFGEQSDTSLKLPDFGQKNVNVLTPNQENNQQIDENGYFYNPPQTQFTQNLFPTRFRDQELPSTTQPMSHKMPGKGTSVRPFQTPEVYNQPSATKLNKQKYGDEQSTTRKPFMTSRVTSPEDDSDADYDYGEDYTTDQKTDEESINSTTRPNENGNVGNRRPSQPMQTTRPQYGQRTRVTQKGTVAPSQEPDYYNTVTPDYASTTPKPTQNSRFGSTEAPKQVMKQLQRRPSNSRRPSTSTAVGRPDLSKPATGTSDSRYQTTSPPLGYPSTTVVPVRQPGYDSRLPYGPTGSTPQNYPTYTTTSSTAIPTNPSNQIITGSFVPSGTPGTYQTSLMGTYQNSQQNQPIRSQYTTTGRPERPTSATYIPGTYPTTTPEYYQTTYQQGPIDDTGKPGTFIFSGPGTTAPGSSPTGTYQSGYRGSPTPDYATTAIPETRTNSPIDTGLPRSYYSQPSPTGYEYSRPVYSTTTSPSTIGTTPGSFIPSTTSGRPFQEYSSTQRPSYPSTQGIYGQSPVVDGFGRPILSEQRSTGQEVNQYPETQFKNGNNLRGPGGLIPGSNGLPSDDIARDNLRPMYGGEQSANYSGYYGQPQVVGEDFSGPKQPQRFDPQTGYHY